MISYETMNLLIKYFQDYPELKGIPASSEEIKYAENILRIKFHDDYIEFIKKFGGASAGLDIHAFHNSTLIGKETVIELTQGFRKLLELHEQPMNKLYAISDDGSGNPILMDQQGHIFIYYHDSSEMEILYESLDRLLHLRSSLIRRFFYCIVLLIRQRTEKSVIIEGGKQSWQK